ncbi:MAG: signal recognition particle-docking protein FtsY [Archangiaceae bacterium]|nr:signal recognition particle-docking protein FtsY [Archangiaceae bacterium]
MPQLIPGFDNTLVFAAGGALALLLVIVLALLLRKKPAPPLSQAEAPKQVTAETATVKVTLPPSELEAQKRAEEERARAQAEEARRQRNILAGEGTSADKLAELKETEEAAKKVAYEARKAAEAEARERKKREEAEAVRLREQAAKEAAEAEVARQKAEAEAEAVRVAAQAGQTLAQGLAKTRSEGFMSRLNGLFGGAPRAIDEKVLGELEEVLFTADIGVRTAASLVETAREKAKKNELTSADGLKGVIRKEVARIVDLKANHRLSGGGPPHVIMVVGVNGAGKTTTIGKLAAKATASGKKVVLAAGDTFRAAAAEQLDVWAERAHAQLVKGKDEADPASVVFDAVKKGIEVHADLVIADTAGRLHTKANLMEELKKVRRVIEKALPGAPHEVLLVLDSTNGQNAIAQARQFHDTVGITSIALTKLDGTAKGGVIIGICDELKVPVAWAGVGEKVEDLRPFEPTEFVEALFD